MLNKQVCEDCIRAHAVARALVDPEEENAWRATDDINWERGKITCPESASDYQRNFKEAYDVCPRQKEHKRKTK